MYLLLAAGSLIAVFGSIDKDEPAVRSSEGSRSAGDCGRLLSLSEVALLKSRSKQGSEGHKELKRAKFVTRFLEEIDKREESEIREINFLKKYVAYEQQYALLTLTDASDNGHVYDCVLQLTDEILVSIRDQKSPQNKKLEPVFQS